MPTPRTAKRRPQELQDRTATGKPRCLYWREDEDRIRQCKRTARPGFSVCYRHGAGSAKREREGRAKNPATVNVLHGGRTRRTTLAMLHEGADPVFVELYRRHLESDALFDTRPLVATSRALLDLFLMQADLGDTDGSRSKTPPALAAIDRIARGVLATIVRTVKIEKAIGVVTIEELRHYIQCVGETLDRFLPPEAHAAAIEYLTERLRSRDLGRHWRVPAADEPPE